MSITVPALVQTFDPTWLAIPIFTALTVAEMIAAKMTGRARFEPKDSAASLLMGFGSVVAGIVFGALTGAWVMMVYQARIFDIGFVWWAWIAAFVLDDFLYYWSHRWAHTVRWFWADHVVHHSSQHYNLTTALRQPWFGVFTLKFMWLGSLLALVGFHPAMIGFVSGLNLIYQFWIHTEVIKKCPPWFEAVMNTPSHHRVHHGINARYLDRNYAGVFIVWDKMFGTFQPELDDEDIRYGVVKNLGTYNPLKISLHEWFSIINDMRRAGNWRDAMMYLLAPPGWSPDGSRLTSKEILERWEARQSGGVPESQTGETQAKPAE